MILKELFNLINIAFESIGKTYKEVRMCELGDQRMKWNKYKIAKKYFLNKGILEHISIDWNQANGALKRDLSKAIDEWPNYFDIVTNFGTTEHVDGQYDVFKNIHNFTKTNGAMVHAVPMVGHWKGHCKYHYQPDFFKVLAPLNEYKIIVDETRIIQGRGNTTQPMICSVLIKTTNKDFITEEQFRKMNKITGLK